MPTSLRPTCGLLLLALLTAAPALGQELATGEPPDGTSATHDAVGQNLITLRDVVGGGYSLTAAVTPGTVTYGDEIVITITVSNDTDDPVFADLWLVTTRAGDGSYVEYIGARTVPANTTATRIITHTIPLVYEGIPLTPGDYTVTVNAGDFDNNDVIASDSYSVTITATRVAAMEAGEPATTKASGDTSAPATAAAAAGPAAVSPNPFSGRATLSFSLAEAAEVRLAVYDVLGREVATLVSGRMDAGSHTAVFDARGLAAGVYVYRLAVGNDVQTGRMTLSR